ncbi:hypothetical protein MUK42_36310 [Musa troglodytarum]|uniref:Uncharacterized protein n=1 Tax=Musa troglodytarum TaxID=320322 RepID=A0A9E7GER2_9LILI|nr:hypothetical protein MUK42_36321 [Musa troglodytarum]URE10614.1 hypothetical protein MUK42_36310 [Musa troglodytarum]
MTVKRRDCAVADEQIFLSFVNTLLVSASPPFPWSLNPFITSLLLEQQSYQLQILVPPLRVLASALLGVL